MSRPEYIILGLSTADYVDVDKDRELYSNVRIVLKTSGI